MSLSLESSVEDVQGNTTDWLINKCIEDNTGRLDDVDFDINNITETSSCMFGFQMQDVELNQAQKEILSSIDAYVSDDTQFVLIKSFKEGYEMIKDIDNRLTNAPTWEDC